MAATQQQTYAQVDPNDAIKSWDLNGDGQITALEMAVAHDKQVEMESTTPNLKKVVCVCITLCLVVIGTMLATTILANELSKDTRPDSQGVLEDTKGNTIKAQMFEENTIPLDEALLSMDPSDLRNIDKIDFVDSSTGAMYFLQINAAIRHSASKVELFPSNAIFKTIVVTPGYVKAVRADDQVLFVVTPEIDSTGSRRLLGKGGKRVNAFCNFKGKIQSVYDRTQNKQHRRSFANWDCVCVPDDNGSYKKRCHWNPVPVSRWLENGGFSPGGEGPAHDLGNEWDEDCNPIAPVEPCDQEAQDFCVSQGYTACTVGVNSATCGPPVCGPSGCDSYSSY